MSTWFWIGFFAFAAVWYFFGFVGWRVQKDALKRGYGGSAANFWGVGVIFMPFIFLPLYAWFRHRAPGYVTEEYKPGTTTLCPHCAEINPKDATVCKECGKSLDYEPPPIGEKACPNCGEMNPATAEYCEKCDERISFED
jgi:ribosomal protein L40E